VLVAEPLNLSRMTLGFMYFVFLPAIFTTTLAGALAARVGTRPALWIGLGLAGAGLPLLLLPSLPTILAGNPPETRLAKLPQFWDLMQAQRNSGLAAFFPAMPKELANAGIYSNGIKGFFVPNPQAVWGVNFPLGVEQAAFYSTTPLYDKLLQLTDFEYVNARHRRLKLGAVNVRSGEMCYFDSRDEPLTVKHVMASGALPPAFPAVRIDGKTFWDGGIWQREADTMDDIIVHEISG
jgi:hypothetical protein